MKEKIAEIEQRFQILITISIFFPVLLASLGKILGTADDQVNLLTIELSLLVGFYLLNYVLFQIRKNKLNTKALARLGEWLLVAIAVFIVPILGIVLDTDKLVPAWIGIPTAVIATVAILLTMTLPSVIELIILLLPEK